MAGFRAGTFGARLLASTAAGLGFVTVLGCQGAPTRSLPTVEAAALHVPADAPGPWKPEARYEEIGGPWRVANGGFASLAGSGHVTEVARAVDPFEVSAQPAQRLPPTRPSRPKLSVLRRRAVKEARPVGKTTGKSTVLLAREHFLDYPTRVVAQKITLHIPATYGREVQLTGATVTPWEASRRVARGKARLALRELTLEAERITLRVRQDGREDIQIMARGGVGFVADVRANILREEGLRSLLITNDQVVPIR